MHVRAFLAAGLTAAFLSPSAWSQTPPFTLTDQFSLGTAKDVILKGTGASVSLTLAPQMSLTGWVAGPKLSAPLANHALVRNGSRLYMIGGQGDTLNSDVSIATINADGTITAFTKAGANSQLPAAKGFHSAVAYNNVLYVVGGDEGEVGVVTDKVLISTLGADGQPGKWTETTKLPQARDLLTVIADKGFLYALTGASADAFTGTTQSWVAPIHADGTLGDWEETTALDTSQRRYGAGGYLLGDRIELIGGADFDPNTGSQITLADVEAAVRNSDGKLGSWGQQSPLTDSRGFINNSTVSAGGRIYIIGGLDTQRVSSSSVLVSTLSASSATGDWTNSVALPNGAERSNAAAVATDSSLVVTGGETQGDRIIPLDTTFIGTLAPGTAPVPTGTFDSPVVDLGKEDVIGKLEWTATVPPQSSLQAQYRIAPATGVFRAWSSLTATSPITVTDSGQFLQYRFVFTASTGDAPQSPTVTAFTRTSTAPPLTYGDLNGDTRVNVLDAVLGLRFATKLDTPTATQISAGDVAPKPGKNGKPFGDALINVLDVVRILRASVKLDSLP